MRWCYLDSMEYEQALELQERLRQDLLAGRGEETLLLVQHPPVITLGRSGKQSNVIIADQERRRRGVKLVRISRGGDVTYHGPGQLVGYPIRWVGRRVKDHVTGMIRALTGLLAELGVHAWWEEQRPGVWCEGGKIAAVGVDAHGGVAIHGFSLNVDPLLSDYQMIVPCGLHAPITSIAQMLPGVTLPAMETIAQQCVAQLAQSYQVSLRLIAKEQLLP